MTSPRRQNKKELTQPKSQSNGTPPESEELFREIVEGSATGIALVDPKGRIIQVNARLERIFRYSRDELIGQPVATLLPKRFRDSHAAQVRSFFFAPSVRVLGASRDLCGLRKDGREVPIEIGLSPIDTPQGPAVLASIVDISERKQAEEALRASEERFRKIFEHAAEGIAITDWEGRFLRCNPAYCTITGYTEQELSTIQFPSLIHPEDRPHKMRLIRQLMSGDLPSFEVENRYMTKSGDPVWVHKYVSILRNDKGESTHLITLVTDITERKQAEEERKALMGRNQALVEALGEVVYDWRPQANELDWGGNYTTVLGYSPQEMGATTDSWTSRVHPDDLEHVLAEVERATRERRNFNLEYRFLHRDGSYRWMHDRGVLTVTPQGELSRAIGIFVDITDRKQAEEVLRRSREELQEHQAQLQDLTAKLLTAQESERQRIARDLHDDVSQRLAALVLDVASLAQQPPPMPELTVRALEPIRVRLEQLADDIHNLAFRLHPSLLNHAGLQPAIEDHIREVTRRTGLPILLKVGGIPSSILLDRSTCLFRVMQESVQNVIKHANATAVTVKLSGSSKGIGLSVTDNGKGFDPHDKSAHQKGLGLISMQERLRLLNGFLRIHSRPADGTKVCAWIPFQEGSS